MEFRGRKKRGRKQMNGGNREEGKGRRIEEWRRDVPNKRERAKKREEQRRDLTEER